MPLTASGWLWARAVELIFVTSLLAVLTAVLFGLGYTELGTTTGRLTITGIFVSWLFWAISYFSDRTKTQKIEQGS